MLAFGIMLGLCAATSQSLSYLFSRHYTAGQGERLMQLLVVSHTIQGVVCLPLMVLLWPAELPSWRQWALPVAGVAVFYLAGQAGLFVALGRTAASRVSPLLGLKIAMLAGLTVVLLGEGFGALQWLAVGLAVVGAFAINYTGGAMPRGALVVISLTCLGYALSDLCIGVMIRAMRPVHPLHAGLFGAAVSYVVCGGLVAPLLPWWGTRRREAWVAAAPYAAAWLIGMGFLYTCYAVTGVVLGNIVQSMRGLISVGLGGVLAARGVHHLEVHVPPRVFWMRVAAAVLMTLAVGLFVVGGEWNR